MTDIQPSYCPNCSLIHVGGPCDHDPDAPCFQPGCKRPRGFRWLGADRQEVKPRTRCWHCWWASQGHPPLPEIGQEANHAA